ncbi:GMC oxidoreductase [Streptomyces lavendulae]|uniref:GMC oxidoreductase n=1 Tax=Streptomyces lavendulae TaxID=1914 RepID=UPI0036B687CB
MVTGANVRRLDTEGPAAARQPRHPRRERRHPPGPRREEQHRLPGAPPARAQGDARTPGDARAPPAAAQHLPAQGHAHRGATAHQAGTVRFGTDPRSSALDVDCKAHDLETLYVVDTSFFPSIGAVHPPLTATANALRVGDRLIERMR